MRRFFVAMAAVLLASSAQAADDPLIEGAELCTSYLPRYEREFGIPVHMLAAIASTESGRWDQGLRIAVPWPWTINAAGKGYFFKTKEDAIAAVRELQARGIKSIDVGCMQVNLMHHPQAFASLEDAFEPQRNVAYAASFLRSLFDEMKNWKAAAAAYHSREAQEGAHYVSQVYDHWYNIIERVREARLSMGAPAEPQLAEAAAEAADRTPPTPISVKPTLARASYSPSRGVRDISVHTMTASRENGIIVVRPEIKISDTVPMGSVPVAAADSPAPATVPPEAHVIRISADGSSGSAPGSGPRFIFND